MDVVLEPGAPSLRAELPTLRTAVSPPILAQGQTLSAALHLREMHRHFPSAVLQSDHVHLHPPLGCDPGSPSACDGNFSTSICARPGPSSSARDTAA